MARQNSETLSAARARAARAANEAKAAKLITLTCSRCKGEYQTTGLRSSSKFCSDGCRDAHDSDEWRRWKTENRDRYLAKRRLNEKVGRLKESKHARAKRRAERLRAQGLSSNGRPFRDRIMLTLEERAQRRQQSRINSLKKYYDNIDRERERRRIESFKTYRNDPIAGATKKARRKWRKMYGDVVDRPDVVLLLEQRLELHRQLGMFQARGGGQAARRRPLNG